jgi:ribonuclease T1
MADRRLGSVVTILVIVGALLAVWWIDRSRREPVRVVPAPDSAVAPVPIPRADPPPDPSVSPEIADIDLQWIADPAERAEVVRVATAIDRGGPYAHADDGAAFLDLDRRLPPRPPGYWRVYTVAVPGAPTRRLVSGERREIYYTRDDRAFTAVRGATP